MITKVKVSVFISSSNRSILPEKNVHIFWVNKPSVFTPCYKHYSEFDIYFGRNILPSPSLIINFEPSCIKPTTLSPVSFWSYLDDPGPFYRSDIGVFFNTFYGYSLWFKTSRPLLEGILNFILTKDFTDNTLYKRQSIYFKVNGYFKVWD